MNNVLAIPSAEFLELLKHDLSAARFSYMLLGAKEIDNLALSEYLAAKDFTLESAEVFKIYERECDAVYSDEFEQISFDCTIALDEHIPKNAYAIALVRTEGKKRTLISLSEINRIAFVRGVGGTFCIKLCINHSEKEVIFINEQNFATVNMLREAMLVQATSNLAQMNRFYEFNTNF